MDDKLTKLRVALGGTRAPANSNVVQFPTQMMIEAPLFSDVTCWVTEWAYKNAILINHEIIGTLFLGCYDATKAHKDENPSLSHGQLQRWLIAQLEELHQTV